MVPAPLVGGLRLLSIKHWLSAYWVSDNIQMIGVQVRLLHLSVGSSEWKEEQVNTAERCMHAWRPHKKG